MSELEQAPVVDETAAERRLRLRALAAIREGRVRVYVADRCWDADFREWRPSLRLLAHVTSSIAGRAPYEVRFVDGCWTCSCSPDLDATCKHRTAVAMVTGHWQPGAKVVRAEA